MGNLLYAYAAMRALAGLFLGIMRGKAREKSCVAEIVAIWFWMCHDVGVGNGES